jgi:hypothetical protein
MMSVKWEFKGWVVGDSHLREGALIVETIIYFSFIVQGESSLSIVNYFTVSFILQGESSPSIVKLYCYIHLV